MIAAICALLLVAPAAALAVSPGGARTEHRFLWDEANTGVATAQTGEDFLVAAQTYRKLIKAGVRNGPVFYNLGLCLMQAKQYGEALDVLYRAERYGGSNDDIVHNILICLSEGRRDHSIALPWYRSLLFWHFGLSTSTRATMAAGAFLLCWVALLLRLLQARQVAGQVFTGALAFLILFGSSAVTSLLQEYHCELSDQRTELTAPTPPANEASGGSRTADTGR